MAEAETMDQVVEKALREALDKARAELVEARADLARVEGLLSHHAKDLVERDLEVATLRAKLGHAGAVPDPGPADRFAVGETLRALAAANRPNPETAPVLARVGDWLSGCARSELEGGKSEAA